LKRKQQKFGSVAALQRALNNDWISNQPKTEAVDGLKKQSEYQWQQRHNSRCKQTKKQRLSSRPRLPAHCLPWRFKRARLSLLNQ
jgi:hypothetical protein